MDEVEDAHEDGITRLVFNANGASLATASQTECEALVSHRQWRTDGAEDVHRSRRSVNGIALSPDGKTLATASFDGRVGLFRVGPKDERQFIDAQKGKRLRHVRSSGTKLLSAG